MDAVGMDLQLSDRAYSEYGETRRTVDEPSNTATEQTTETSPTEDTDGPSSGSNYTISSSSSSPSPPSSFSSLSTSTTVPVGEPTDAEPQYQGQTSTSSTGSNSSTDSSRIVGTSLYVPEFLAPSISYERQSPDQLLVALIGRAFDQPEKLASQLQPLVSRLPNSESPVAKFTPFTVKRKTLCRGYFDSSELKQHNLICLCYNASEARILLTGPDGYYTALLKQIEIQMGPNKVAFVVSNYSPNRSTPTTASTSSSESTAAIEIVSPVLRQRLSQQPALVSYLETNQVLSWADEPLTNHCKRLVQIARQEPNPLGFFQTCSVM